MVVAKLGNTRRSRVVSVNLNISEKFDDLDKMEITSSESKVNMEGSVKGLVTALYLKTKSGSKNIKKTWYAIVNVSKKDLSKKTKEFEKLSRYFI